MIDNDLESTLRRQYRATMEETCEGCRTAGIEHQDEHIIALVLGELDAAQSAALRGQIVRCRRCADSYRNALELHREAAPRLLGTPSRSSRTRRWTVAMAAAVAVLAVGLGIGLVSQRQDSSTPAIGGDVLRAPVVAVDPADGATLDEAPSEMHWEPQLGATGYVVVLFADGATEVWRSPSTEQSRVELPEAVRSGMEPGHYSWHVKVEGRVQRSRLGAFRFEIGGP